MTPIKSALVGAAGLLAATLSANAQPQYAQQPQNYGYSPTPYGYPPVQYYPSNPAPAAPPSWSYNPYTSGLGPCTERGIGDDRCSTRIFPTAGQPNYWTR